MFLLADLMLAADAMNSGLKVLLSNVPKDKIHTMGKVLIGTVQGDVHDLGKSIVTAMFTASDFEVHDLGVDCPCSKIRGTSHENPSRHNCGVSFDEYFNAYDQRADRVSHRNRVSLYMNTRLWLAARQ